jgi:putative FmdB family regulatory protein
MPLYEYRCRSCQALTTALRSAADSEAAVACECCGAEARRIVSRTSVHRSNISKVDRLDPRYDKLVDKAISSTGHADPDRYLKRMKRSTED